MGEPDSASGRDGPQDRIEDLLLECLRRPRAEWHEAIAQLCARYPRDAESIRRRFELFQRLEGGWLADSEDGES